MRPREAAKIVQYATLRKRLKALAFDYVVILGYIALLSIATLAVVKTAGLLGLSLRWPENPVLADLTAFITLILPVTLYFAFGESSSNQATWGKRRAGIKVVDDQGRRLKKRMAFVRSVVKLMPWQIAHTSIFQMGGFTSGPVQPSAMVIAGFTLVYVMVGVYVASAGLTKKHRTPYDWLSGAFVITAR